MLKKFVPLDSEVKSSYTPFNIKTFQSSDDAPEPLNIAPCSYEEPITKTCVPGKVKPERPMTIEEAIFRWVEIPQDIRFERKCRKNWRPHDNVPNKCLLKQKTPKELQQHAVARENYIKVKADTKKTVDNDKDGVSNGPSVIEVQSLVFEDDKRKPKPASPSCSKETFYVPSRRLLDLKRPKSGVFINETPRPVETDIPYPTYDPRRLQHRLESEQRLKYQLYSDGDQFYFPWMKRQNEDEDKQKDKKKDMNQDSEFFKPYVFPIPTDLEKTFKAEVVFGTVAIVSADPDIKESDSRPKEIATIYVAYVESFVKSPDYWTAETIDSIISDGNELHQLSIDKQFEHPNSEWNIIPELTAKEATVETKHLHTTSLKGDANILKSLTVFFDSFNSAILIVESLYFLIWKRCTDSFYIFDPNGRNVDCKRDISEGNASLMIIKTIEHIVHLILNYSQINKEADFNLYQISLKDYGKLPSPLQLSTGKKTKKRFAVVNRFYSIVPALSGLPTKSGGLAPEENPSLMIGYLVLVYAQIDEYSNWTVQVIDDLIKFGKMYHNNFVVDNRLQTRLNIADLPEVLFFGNYRVLIEKKPFVESGHVVECKSFKFSQLTIAVTKFLRTYDSGLIQIDSATFAFWKEEDDVFLLDPFKRGPAGLAYNADKNSKGLLQHHLNIESFCRILFINATTIKSVGIFFIHGIRVKAIGTFNINRALTNSTGFGKLQIKYPFDCASAQMKADEIQRNDAEKMIFKRSIVECLSQLSVKPCERVCSERDFRVHQQKLEMQKQLVQAANSIESIPEQYRIDDYDNIDVIDGVVNSFLNDLMDRIQRKTEKKQKTCLEASKVLLKSDIAHLEDLKIRLKRGEDYDNICQEYQTKPSRPAPKYTVKEELALPSSFKPLPDGSWAIFGKQNELDISRGSLKGILMTIMAAALSAKYRIATWNSDVIDYAIDSCAVMEDRFWSYSHTLDMIFRKQIPKIQLGSTTFEIRVHSCNTVDWENLKYNLELSLLKVSKLFLICKGLSCMIIKRYNFMYMFMGCSCDIVGFRSQSAGPVCLLRFLEINALVRRIEQACGPCQKYVLVEIEVKEVNDTTLKRYVSLTESQEQLMFEREVAEKKNKRRRFKEKMQFIEREIRRESKRLGHFQEAKEVSPKKKKGKKAKPAQYRLSDASFTGNAGIEQEQPSQAELDEISEASVEFKHIPRDPSARTVPPKPNHLLPPKLGYQLREKDCLFKIQGSTALEGRATEAINKIKPCYYASAVALLYAILRPLHHWDSSRIDKVISMANKIAKKTTNFNATPERILKNIDLDEFVFEVKVRTYVPPGSFGGHFEFLLNKALNLEHYILLQLTNITFTVYRDQFYHLFDPYPLTESDADNGENEEESPRLPEDIPKQPEENTASWILFGSMESMVEYIQKRATSSDNWKKNYKLHAMSIMSYKTASKREQLVNLLTDDFDICRQTFKADNLCTHPEEIEWLNIYPMLLIWSRLNRTNAVNRIRGSPMTKDKNFDIEIPKKLFSLWGSIHPMSMVFGDSRNKQHLAIDVVACCVATIYRVNDWNCQIIDSIVITGNEYYNDSIASIDRQDFEISLEHLNTSFQMSHLNFTVHLESAIYGYLYTKAKNELNLAAALGYFFTENDYGIVQCLKRSLAIGKTDTGGYFMFECQSHGLPLFPNGQGAAYVLRASQLQVLLYCIIMTLDNRYFNSQFTIHKVEITNDVIENVQEEEEEDE